MKAILMSLMLSLAAWSSVAGIDFDASEDAYVRVIDVGAGLCCVAQVPGDDGPHWVIYDAGLKENALADIQLIIPEDSRIDVLILSHSDADHLGAVDEICDLYTVDRVLRTGFVRTTQTWQAANGAIALEVQEENCLDINLTKSEFPPGATYRVGDGFITFVCGFDKSPPEWNLSSKSHKRNAISIIARLSYMGRSVLFCGDAVGRHGGDNDNVCIATESFAVEMSEAIPIASDVIVAPHHGADNGSSKKFIEAVDPDYVIFSCGHKYAHPRKATASRYLDHGIASGNIFRTDRGDDEGSKEWSVGRVDNANDPIGDDAIEVVLESDGTVRVEYADN